MRQANQNGGIVDVAVRHVVNMGGRRKQFGSVIEIRANDKRSGSAERLADTNAKSFPWTLSAGDPYAALSCTPGNASPIYRAVSKSVVLLGIGQLDSLELTVLI